MFDSNERVALVVRRGLRRRGQAGATAVEYALIAALVAAVVATSIAALGALVLGMFQMGVALFP